MRCPWYHNMQKNKTARDHWKMYRCMELKRYFLLLICGSMHSRTRDYCMLCGTGVSCVGSWLDALYSKIVICSAKYSGASQIEFFSGGGHLYRSILPRVYCKAEESLCWKFIWFKKEILYLEIVNYALHILIQYIFDNLCCSSPYRNQVIKLSNFSLITPLDVLPVLDKFDNLCCSTSHNEF